MRILKIQQRPLKAHGFRKDINNTMLNSNPKFKLLMFPLFLVELYFVFTLILYFLGPVSWVRSNSVLLLLFLITCQTTFCLGYLHEVKKRNGHSIKSIRIGNGSQINKLKIRFFIKFSIVFGLIMTAISAVTYAKISLTSPSMLLQESINAINSPFLVYQDSFQDKIEGGLIYKIIVLAAPITWSAFPLAVAYFKRLSVTYKVLAVAMFFLESVRWILLGRNKGVFDLAIIIITITIIKAIQVRYEKGGQFTKIKRTKYISSLIAILVLITSSIAYFTNAIGDRTVHYTYSGAMLDAPLMKASPVFLHPTLIYLTSYLTQGYYALSKAFELDWVPMFGIGNSMFLIENVGGMLDVDFFKYTYQARLAPMGIDPMTAWHSFYMWVANDFHWFGVVLIMYLLGKYFGYVVKKCVINKVIISYPMLCLLVIMFFYMSGNNQVFSQPMTFMSFWFLFIYWLMARKNMIFSRSVFVKSDE